MDNATAQEIAIKVRALKHCNKLLKTIDERGAVDLKLNCTGVVIHVVRGDINHLNLKVTQAELTKAIGSYEIIQRATTLHQTASTSGLPAPTGASSSSADTSDIEAIQKQKRREYNQRYYAKIKAKRLAARANPN